MRSPLVPFLLALAVTILIGVAVRMEPYFAGDVAVARAAQRAIAAGTWAAQVSRVPSAPVKHYVIAATLAIAFVLTGWKGLALALAFILLEQYGAESTKALFARPRPSPDLINVAGKFSGFSFPSTTMTFFAVTFGSMAVLASAARQHSLKWPVLIVGTLMLIAGGLARVLLGAHWPSDVILTVVVCVTWFWAATRVALRKA